MIDAVAATAASNDRFDVHRQIQCESASIVLHLHEILKKKIQ